MSNSVGFLPEEHEVVSAIEGLVLPKVRILARDVSRRLELEAVIMVGNREALSLPMISAGDPDTPKMGGQLRFRFRRAFTERILVQVEGLFVRNETLH